MTDLKLQETLKRINDALFDIDKKSYGRAVDSSLLCENPACNCVGDLFYAKAEIADRGRRLRLLKRQLRDIASYTVTTLGIRQEIAASLAEDKRLAKRSASPGRRGAGIR